MPSLTRTYSQSRPIWQTDLALKRFMLVGYVGNQNDQIRLEILGRELCSAGFLSSPEAIFSDEVELRPVQIRNGEDFLMIEEQADAVFILFIDDSTRSTYLNLMKSPLHFEQDIWRKAAQRVGAKFIWAVGGENEVNGRHFRGGNFVQTPHSGDEKRRHESYLFDKTYVQALCEQGGLRPTDPLAQQVYKINAQLMQQTVEPRLACTDDENRL